MTLADGPARDRIATELDRTLFVEAGAGTGKTTSLVDRIVSLVSQGPASCAMRDIAAITFTENAAAELRSRVRAALTAARATNANVHADFEAAVADLDDAALATLHGFAYRLLADHPISAGLPPGFTVQDEIRAGLERDLWWDRVVDASLDNPHLKTVWTTALALDLTPSALRRIADQLAASWDLLIPAVSEPGPIPAWDLKTVTEPVRAAVDRYATPGPDGDPLTNYLRGPLTSLLADLEAEDDDLGRASVLLAERGISTRHGNADTWEAAGTPKSGPAALLMSASDAWCAQLAAVRTACLEHLLFWLRRVVLDDADRRQREGALHFHDLLVLAQRLLADNDDVRQRLHRRWPVILVDEFQDTDPLQVRIVHQLASDIPHEHWQDATVAPGRLFFVGDPKQSIYRFRRADVSLYQEVQKTIADRPALTRNFRSRPGILRFVNCALGELMRGKPQQVDYRDLHPARTGPAASDPGPDVLLLGGPVDGDIAAAREEEARHVAFTCRRVVADGWLVREGTGEGSRLATYRDVAILVPTRTSVSGLEKELQAADVPYRIESRSLVWDTDTVHELLAILEAIADPGDAVAVVAALRSAAFGCTDLDLLQWHRAGGRWDYRFGGNSDDEHVSVTTAMVNTAMAALHRYHRAHRWTPVNALIDLLIRERRMVELTTGLARPRDHWRRLRFVADQSRAFLDGGGSSLGGFLRWAREQAERGADAVETVVNEPDDNAIRVLTIHSAKGLEFPVTVLSGVNVDDRLDVNLLWSEHGLEVKVKGFQTSRWAEAYAAERSMVEAESVRLLYVAATRARDHLAISLYHKVTKSPAKNHAARLFTLLETLKDAGACHETSAGEPLTPSRPAEEPVVVDLAARDAFFVERAELLDRLHRTRPVTASELSGSDDEPVDELTEVTDSAEQVDQPVVIRAPISGGATLGSAVHRVLELVDFSADEGAVLRMAAAVTAELEVPHLRAETARRVAVALRSDLLRTAGSDARKEVPVSAPVGERTVEGYIDLVLRRADGLVVVDYKTDATSTEADITAKVDHYAPQLRAYAAALASATGQPVVAAALLFLGPVQATTRYVSLE